MLREEVETCSEGNSASQHEQGDLGDVLGLVRTSNCFWKWHGHLCQRQTGSQMHASQWHL